MGWGEGGFHWAGLPQLPAYRSQWKFIFLIRHISFIVRLDSMLKLIRNYINPNGFAVQCICEVEDHLFEVGLDICSFVF